MHNSLPPDLTTLLNILYQNLPLFIYEFWKYAIFYLKYSSLSQKGWTCHILDVKRDKCLIDSSKDKSLYEKFFSWWKSYYNESIIVSYDAYITISPFYTHSSFFLLSKTL